MLDYLGSYLSYIFVNVKGNFGEEDYFLFFLDRMEMEFRGFSFDF